MTNRLELLLGNERALALLKRWRDESLNEDASALGDLTSETTDFLEIEPVSMGEPWTSVTGDWFEWTQDERDLAAASGRTLPKAKVISRRPDPVIGELAVALHRRFCDRSCPPRSELHVDDQTWLADARAIATDMTRDEKRRYRLAVILDQ